MADKIANAELSAKLDALAASQQSRKAPEGLAPLLNKDEISEQSWYEDPAMVARMIIDGATFGFSDEIAAAVGAGLQTALGKSESYSSSYSNIVDRLESERTAYEANNKGAAIGLNIVGGLLTAPVSLTGSLARGVALAGKGLSRALPVSKSLTGLPTEIARVVDAGASVAAKAPTISSVARGGAEMAAQGALAGVGFAERGEDNLDAALEGALLSMATGAAMKGIGKAAQASTARRVTEDLGKGDDFIPLNVVDSDGKAGKIYSSVIGNLPIARTLLKNQTNRIAAPLKQDIENITEKIVTREQSATARFLDAQTNSLKNLHENAQKKIAAGVSEAEEQALIQANINRQANLTARIQKLEKYYSDAEAGFRRDVSEASLPSSIRVSEKAKVLNPENTMQDVNNILSESWTKRGFEVLKNRTFRISPESLANKININAGDELSDIAQLYGVSKAKIPEIINDFVSSNVVNGRISGEKLSDLRNTISRSAYSLSQQGGESAVRGFAMRKVLGEIEDTITDQLTPANLAKFQADKTAYKTFLNLSDSIAASSKQIGKRGTFTPQDWMNSLYKNSRKDLSKGKAVFQKEADSFAALRGRIDEDLNKAKDLTKNFSSLTLKAKEAALATQEVELLKQQTMAARRASQDEIRSLNLLKKNLEDKKSQLQAIQNTLPNNDNISNLTSTGIVTGLFTGYSDVASIAAFGALAATPSFQRVVAGQTSLQQAASQGIKQITPAAEALRKATQIGVVAEEASSASLNEQLTTARIGTPAAKAAMFRKLYSEGKLERLRSIDPAAFNSLRQAAE